MSNELILISLLITKHFVTDFVLQGEYQFKNKGIYGHPGGILHAAITGIGTAVVLGAAAWFGVEVIVTTCVLVTLVEAIAHYHIDWAKVQVGHRWELTHNHPHFWNLLGLDQWAHYITYVWMVWYLTS